MTITNRKIFSVAAVVLVLLIAAVWSIAYLSDASDDADRSFADLATTRDLVRRIESKRPNNITSDSAVMSTQVPRLLDSAMKTAEIDPDNLDRISPQPTRQSDQGSMTEVPLRLNFRQITLRQVLTFVTSLTDTNKWLTIRDLHLTYPATGTAWNAEITLSYLTKPAIGTALAN